MQHTRKRHWLWAVIVAAMVAAPAARVHAIDLFQIRVTDLNGMIPDLTVGGTNLPDLLDQLLNQTGAFAAFSNTAFEATLTYAGIANAITVTFDPVAQEATLQFTLLGADATTFTFSGTDLFNQIEEFLKNQLSQEIQAFLKKVNTLSLIAVTDGTPLSTTALSATFVYDRFGLHADLTAREMRDLALQDDKKGARGRVDAYVEGISTDQGDGFSIAVAPSLQYVFGDRVSLGLLFPIAYHEIEGSRIVNIHANIAMPINVLIPSNDAPLGLRMTPFGTFAGSGSVDLIAGGLIGGGGLITTLTFEAGEVTVSGTNQFSFHEGIVLRYEDWEFDPGVSQTIMKNGIKLTYRIGDNAFVYGAITSSVFLNSAAVDEYLTPEAGFGWRTANGFNLSVGYRADIADGYNSHSMRLTFQLPF